MSTAFTPSEPDGEPTQKASATAGEPQSDGAFRQLSSDALLQGQKAIVINHNGAIYRLQSTKLGKLILTK